MVQLETNVDVGPNGLAAGLHRQAWQASEEEHTSDDAPMHSRTEISSVQHRARLLEENFRRLETGRATCHMQSQEINAMISQSGWQSASLEELSKRALVTGKGGEFQPTTVHDLSDTKERSGASSLDTLPAKALIGHLTGEGDGAYASSPGCTDAEISTSAGLAANTSPGRKSITAVLMNMRCYVRNWSQAYLPQACEAGTSCEIRSEEASAAVDVGVHDKRHEAILQEDEKPDECLEGFYVSVRTDDASRYAARLLIDDQSNRVRLVPLNASLLEGRPGYGRTVA